MASRMNLLRNVCQRVIRSIRKPCFPASLLLVAECASDDKTVNSNIPKPLKLLDQREMTHEALIKQACSLTANSSSQLLTQVLLAINDISQEYRQEMSELMVLLEEGILHLTYSSSSSLDDVEILIVEKRNLVEEHRKILLELVTLMDYVEKMVTATAVTSFLAGSEPSSTLMCERMSSAQSKVEEECLANKRSEEELLRLQEKYVVKLGELYEREWKGNGQTEPKGVPGEEAQTSPIVTFDIFEDSLPIEEHGEPENDPL